MKLPDAAGTDRNSESPPGRNRCYHDRARGNLIWDHKKRLSRFLAGGLSAEAWSVSRRQISDARQSLAASFVIIWALLGIRASAAGRATGRTIGSHGQISRAHLLSQPPGDEEEERECCVAAVIGA